MAERARGVIFRILAGTIAVLVVAACDGPPRPLPPEENEAASVAPLGLEPTGRVSDFAGVLSDREEAALSAKLERIESATLHQVVVVTTPTLDGRDISRFTDELGNAWGVGRKGFDDGAVVLVAPNDRQARISVANGLLDQLSNADSRGIMGEHMIPNFRAGRYYDGLDEAIDAIGDALK